MPNFDPHPSYTSAVFPIQFIGVMHNAPNTDYALQALASRLHNEVPVLPTDRAHLRMWRPRGNLFFAVSMGLLPVHPSLPPPSSPQESNNDYGEKIRFLSDVRDFLQVFDADDLTSLRQAESQHRQATHDAPFSGLSEHLQEILHPESEASPAMGLPLRQTTGYAML